MSIKGARVTGASAIIAVILLFAFIATWRNPQFNGPLHDMTNYFVGQSALAQASVDLNLIGAIPSTIFAVGLFLLLRARGEAVLAYMSLMGAALVNAVTIMFMTSNEALIAFAGQATGSELRLGMALDNSVDNMLFFAMGFWLGTASLGIVRSKMFASWIGWLGLVAGLCMLAADMVYMTAGLPTGMLGVLLFVIWSFAIGVSLLLRPARTPDAMPLSVDAVSTVMPSAAGRT